MGVLTPSHVLLTVLCLLLFWQFLDAKRKLNESLDAHRDTLVKQGEQLRDNFETLHHLLDAKQDAHLVRQKLQRYIDIFGELEYDPEADDDADDEEDDPDESEDDDYLNDHH